MNEIKAHDTMSPNAQRIAIAEACGWMGPYHHENIKGMDGWYSQHRGIWWVTPDKNRVLISDVPDYLNDLNACHEFEKTLTDPQRKKYQSVLIAEVIGWSAYDNERISIHATAAQRCEAFLRTLDLWKP